MKLDKLIIGLLKANHKGWLSLVRAFAITCFHAEVRAHKLGTKLLGGYYRAKKRLRRARETWVPDGYLDHPVKYIGGNIAVIERGPCTPSNLLLALRAGKVRRWASRTIARAKAEVEQERIRRATLRKANKISKKRKGVR